MEDLKMAKKIKNVCAVTGGGRGIGLSIAKYLLQKDYKVAILDISIDYVSKELNEEIQKNNLIVLKADITKFSDVKKSFNIIKENFGAVGILVNNAGIVFTKKFIEEDEENWDKVIDINLKGAYLCCKAAVPDMIDQKFGRIVNISSTSGLQPSVFSCSAYCASKAGIIGFSRCLASQLANYNIRVNCVAPCTTETPMIDNLGGNIKQDYIKRVPLGRLAKPIDITNAVYFLITDKSDLITGETLNVNGGIFMP
jgi:3-oxoacyl-[acyl-carrier protein] reductase